jgi:hypothetical protein
MLPNGRWGTQEVSVPSCQFEPTLFTSGEVFSGQTVRSTFPVKNARYPAPEISGAEGLTGRLTRTGLVRVWYAGALKIFSTNGTEECRMGDGSVFFDL